MNRLDNDQLSEAEKRSIEKAHEHVTKESAIKWLDLIEQGKAELHPYALKIIARKATGNHMNRLESIKERLNLRKHSKTLCNAPRLPAFDYVDQDELDIDYLLQRLERYEKALNDVSEHCYSCGGEFVSPEKYCIKIVKEALKDNEIT
jgi:hypothetical protein